MVIRVRSQNRRRPTRRVITAVFLATAVVFNVCECQDSQNRASVCRQPSALAGRYVDDTHHMFARSEVTALPGHWPAGYCRISNVFLRTSAKTFYVENPNAIDRCFGTRDIWKFASKRSAAEELRDDNSGEVHFDRCDQVYDLGHAFTMYYYYGSNYFHLHFDTVLPLYYSLWWQVAAQTHRLPMTPLNSNVKNTVLMPAVETDRGRGINWETDAFFNDSAYWNQLLQIVVHPYQLLPLDTRLAAIDKTLCFREILFGTPKVNVSHAGMIQSFAAFIKSKFNTPYTYDANTTNKQMGLIKRNGRRKILNDNQLMEALRPFVDVELVDFVDYSLEDQIEMMQKYDILAGINGAGLMNAIYLPAKSVAIQLIPFQAQDLNHVEYKNLLQARGPYLEWQNNHSELNRLVSDRFGNSADTLVQVDEFVNLIKEALKLLN